VTHNDINPEMLAQAGDNVLASMCKLPRTGKGLIPMKLWPKQREILNAINDNQITEVVIVKARQVGASQVTALAALGRAIRIPASQTLVVSKGDREAQEVSNRIRNMYSSLPDLIKKNHPIYHANLEEFRLTHPNLPEPTQKHETAITCNIRNLPAGAGRSYSSDFLFADEVDWWAEPEERMADLEPTLQPNSTLVIASTANGYGGFLHRRWLQARGQATSRAIFVGALDRPGRTAEWVEHRRQSLGQLGPQEYPLTPDEAFIATGHNVFDPEAVNWQAQYIVGPPGGRYEFDKQRATRTSQGGWEVWEQPQRDRRYIIAADPAGGGPHSDPSAAGIFDIDSGLQQASYHGRPLPHQLAKELANAGRIYNNAQIVPEANATGGTVIAELLHLGYGHIYEQERYDTLSHKNERRKTLGWTTTSHSKQFAVDALRTQLRERTIGIRDGNAIEEMMRYAETAPGRYEGRGGHDDRVSMLIIAAAILQHSPRALYRLAIARDPRPTREIQDVVAGY
jgi:phage terminase large subunit GpA